MKRMFSVLFALALAAFAAQAQESKAIRCEFTSQPDGANGFSQRRKSACLRFALSDSVTVSYASLSFSSNADASSAVTSFKSSNITRSSRSP